jgi:serine protease Do
VVKINPKNMLNKDLFKNPMAVLLTAVIAGLLGGVLMMFVLTGYGCVSFGGSGGGTVLNYDSVSYVSAWEEAAPAVVSVVAMKDLSEYYNQFAFGYYGTASSGLEEVSSGTAFIITADGLAVTNKHVVEDEEAEYVIVLSDGTELSAEVLGRDILNDIALLQIYGDDERIGDLPTLDFADSDEIQIGEPVLAIGNALGEYANTTTAGIISATGRSILAASSTGGAESLVDLIQTDAAINPGNSGGPLVNMGGELVGMNTAVDSTAEGIGFAIPSNDISLVVSSYQEFGEIVRPFLGVRYVMVNEGMKMRLKLETDYGALVTTPDNRLFPAIVEGSSADKAGLQLDDVILTFNGRELNDAYTLSNAIGGYMVGETVVLEVLRDGEIITLDLTLEAAE